MTVASDTDGDRGSAAHVALAEKTALRGAHVAPAPRLLPRIADRVQGILVATIAVVGALSAAWFVLSRVFHLSLVIILTGSMAPGMPAGTLTVVQEVRAAVVAVGDVVTVPRASSDIPVTHRVIETVEHPTDPRVRTLVLQGDANPRPDTEHYQVRSAGRVVLSAPGVGSLLAAAGQPGVIAFGSVAGGIVVAWLLWPRTRVERAAERSPSHPPEED